MVDFNPNVSLASALKLTPPSTSNRQRIFGRAIFIEKGNCLSEAINLLSNIKDNP